MLILKKILPILFVTLLHLLSAGSLSAATTSACKGIWLSKEEILVLPTTGAGWEGIKSDAMSSWGSASISDQNSNHDSLTFAGALYAVRMNDDTMRKKVIEALESAIGTEDGGRSLAAGRNIYAYVLAADIIEYRTAKFEDWLRSVRNKDLSGRTIINTHEKRPNNWGTHNGASRIAIALYLNDKEDLEKAASVFHGWLGARDVYAGFKYGSLSWQSDPTKPVGINPKGATIDGHNVDGVLPDDQRRGGNFTWPPFKENYVWEALQGAVTQAQMLYRAGYPAWEWEDKAIYRALEWLEKEDKYPAAGDDRWIPWLVNYAYNAKFTAVDVKSHGKAIGYTNWTHRDPGANKGCGATPAGEPNPPL